MQLKKLKKMLSFKVLALRNLKVSSVQVLETLHMKSFRV